MTTPSNPLCLQANCRRVTAARVGLSAAAIARSHDSQDAEDAVIDFLTDLHHFCIARQISFEECRQAAQGRFAAEFIRGAQ